jgi:acetoin utilization deacetylase AcuC-like enzyme
MRERTLLFAPDLGPNFDDFGIDIPINADRALRVHATLGKKYPEAFLLIGKNEAKLSEEDLKLAHTADYISFLTNPQTTEAALERAYELRDGHGRPHRYRPDEARRKLGEMLPELLGQAGATHLAMVRALETGFAFFLGGGMHHAMSDRSHGFCPINDIVIGLRKLKQEKQIARAWVIDIDAHKGDGTAEITLADESILTLSIHMAKGWPLDGPAENNPSFIPSTIDIPIGRGEEASYLEKLERGLEKLADLAPADLAIVVDGADPYELDGLQSSGALKLSREQMLARDMMVYNFLKERGIPYCGVMAGGYGPHAADVYIQFLEQVLKLRGEARV